MRQGLIFDLDGTLWDSTGVIRPVWNAVLAEHGLPPMSEEEMAGLMGLPKAALAARAFPSLTVEEGLAIMDACFSAEQRALALRGAVLYPGLRETLEALHGSYGLYIVSNCAPGYLEAFFQAHGLRGCFDDWETHGGTGLSKGENIRLIVERNRLERAWYIGDTVSDAAAAREAGLPFIHAAYGFGKVPEAAYRLEEIRALPGLMAAIEGA